MKRSCFVFLLPLFMGVACSCAGGNNGGGEGEKPMQIDYKPRQWDGVKRGEVFYEIFVRSFADSDGDGVGDLRGVTEHLDYLDDLGVDGLWLMPINPSPSYHGYDVEDYTAVNPQYGTMADFDELMAEANERGIKIILDFVINHSSKTHPWFENAITSEDAAYRDFYVFDESATLEADIAAGRLPMTNTYIAGQWHNVPSGTTSYKYQGEFSDWMPDLNYGAAETAEQSEAFKAITEACDFWLNKGVAGFRLDAVKHIYQGDLNPDNPRFLKKYWDRLRQTTDDVFLVGEVLSESNIVAPYYAGLPSLFEFSGWWRMETAINSGQGKSYPGTLNSYRNLYRTQNPDFIQSTKLSNHDEDRARSKLSNDLRKCALAASILMTVTGERPFLYYGEELGMLGMKDGDDRNVREPFLWAYFMNDPARTTWMKPKNSTDANVVDAAHQSEDPGSLLNVYKKFIELRNTYPSLAQGEMVTLTGEEWNAQPDQLMVFKRVSGSEELMVVHNCSGSVVEYTIPGVVAAPVAGNGTVVEVDASAENYTVRLSAYSSIVCEME